MAEFIQNGGNNGGNYASHFSCKLSVWENSYDINSNSSNVGYRLELISGSSGRFSDYGASYYIWIGDHYISGNGKYSSQSYNTAQTIYEGSTTVYHNNDGSKNIACTAALSFNSGTYSPGSFDVSGNMWLTQIPRYVNVSIRENTRTVTTITYDFFNDAEVDWIQHRINGGNWVDDEHLNPTYTIKNLTPNTSYQIQVRARRRDSQLWSESNTITMSTYDIAKITKVSDFKFADSLTIEKINPSGQKNIIRLELLNSDKTEATTIVTETATYNSTRIDFIQDTLDTIYKNMRGNMTIIRVCIDTIEGDSKWTVYKDVICSLTGKAGTISIKINENWKKSFVWIKKDNIWKRAIAWIKKDGSWRRGI